MANNLLAHVRTMFTGIGGSLPTANSLQRGMLAIKRATSTEDEVHIGLRDSSSVMQWRRLLTKTYGDTLYQSISAPASPYIIEDSVNSATTSSTTDTSNYSTNVSVNAVLPTGTWTIYAMGNGLYSHSSEGGIVRHRVRIGSDNGTSVSAAININSTRTGMAATHSLTGQTGTVTVYLEYRPNSTGTAYAGGGSLFVIATRTA